ncbi:phenylalanine--tRNA ligase subunit beta [Metamycoplasma alkalescens]|uniref:Phenylalanine--tRNA ligase beta subunit n=2 Tax=Metamycoplasma alkalescens TaxID=45363 RepID=A0A318UD38_9BACT|nr:phenylalanine--tRNA ligase subunit beta [Metamycoplasma alkalescens]PYF43699.1 phenylalanyl-tRNA synthetase beta chain [Metamycoplasma alkalescens]
MVFSYKTLHKLANLKNISIKEMVEAINSIGFEVENYYKFADVEGIKLCHVLKTYKNPNADRLTVCEVEYGNGHKAIIQTTATNMQAGQYVMSFVPGSRSKDLIFSPRKMQGIVSEGMFVGLSEIGFDKEIIPQEFDDQIFQLEEIDLNLDPITYFDLDDWMIEISILSNRADAQCYLVMAKELAAYFQTEIKWPKKPTHNLISNFEIKNLKNTNAFTLVEAANLNLNCSIKEKMLLWKHGIKTFSNAIDLTNLVLLYAGVPCHVYNKNDLKSNEFNVGYYSGKLNILGNKEINFENSLCVFNGSNPISIAATIGLEVYQFQKDTQKVVFELASFNINEIRKNAKQSKLSTLSSQRGSKEISNGSLILAYNFLSQYLTDFSIQINAPRISKKTILIDKAYINKFAGFNIVKTKKYLEVLKKLEILDFKFKEDFSMVTFPTYRYDLDTLQDFVEEVFRFYGYNNFPLKQPKITRLNYQKNHIFDFISKLANKNYANVRTYTLIKPENNLFNPFNITEILNASDAKNYDHSQIRLSLISSLNEILIHHKKQGFEKNSFFDIGMIGRETNVLGLVSNQKTFDEIKLDIISLTNKKLIFKKAKNEIFHPNAAAEIYLDDELIGYIAKIHPKLIGNDAIFAEIKLNKLVDTKNQFVNYKHEPIKTRDITFSLNKFESVQTIIDKIKQIKGIHSYQIIDIYQKDDQIKNITFSFKIEDWEIKKLEQVFEVAK